MEKAEWVHMFMSQTLKTLEFSDRSLFHQDLTLTQSLRSWSLSPPHRQTLGLLHSAIISRLAKRYACQSVQTLEVKWFRGSRDERMPEVTGQF